MVGCRSWQVSPHRGSQTWWIQMSHLAQYFAMQHLLFFFFFFLLCALINIQLLIVYKFLPSSTWICLAKKILELFEQTLRNKHRCHLLFVCAMRSTLRSVFTQFLFVYLFIYLFIFLLKMRNCFRISLDTYQHSLERNICVSVSQILTFLGWDG